MPGADEDPLRAELNKKSEERMRELMAKVEGRSTAEKVADFCEEAAYHRAITEILSGAERLKVITNGDPDGQTYDDPGETFQRVTAGAFCLRLAYQIWQDVGNREVQERWSREAGDAVAAMPAGFYGTIGGVPGRLLSKTKAAGPFVGEGVVADEVPSLSARRDAILDEFYRAGFTTGDVDALAVSYREKIKQLLEPVEAPPKNPLAGKRFA